MPGRLNVLVLILTLGCESSIAIQATPDEARPSERLCSDVLGHRTSAPSHSFYKLAEKSLQSGLISTEDLRNSALRQSPHNLIQIVHSVESQIFSEGFETLLNEFGHLDWPWIQGQLLTLSENRESATETEAIQIDETKLRFDPHLSRTIVTPALANSHKAAFFVTKSGRELVAFSDQGNKFFVIDLNNSSLVLELEISGAVYSKPLYFIDRNGSERLAFGSEGGIFYILDVSDPHKLLKVRTEPIGAAIYSNPTHFSSLDGRDFIAFGSDDYCIYLLDLSSNDSLSCIRTGGVIRNAVVHYRAEDQRDLILAGSTDGYLYLVDILNLNHPIKVSINGEVSGSPLVIKQPGGQSLVAIASKDGHAYLIDPTQGRGIDRIDIGGSASSAPAYAVKSEGEVVLVSVTSRGELRLSPLNKKQTGQEVDLKNTIYSDIVSIKTSDNLDIVSLVGRDFGIYFVDLNRPNPNQLIPLPASRHLEKITRKDGREQFLVTSENSNVLYLIDLYKTSFGKKL